MDTDLERWESLIEEFKDCIFWDDDYAMDEEFLDLPPKVASVTMERLTIDREYFRTVPPEPDGAALIAARQKLAQLLGLPVPDDDGLYSALKRFVPPVDRRPVFPRRTCPVGQSSVDSCHRSRGCWLGLRLFDLDGKLQRGGANHAV